MNDEREPDIGKYCYQMEEIKLRINVVNSFVHGQSSAVYIPTSVESACLQIRKILELIAFASLIANKEAYRKVFAKVSKTWNAGDLLKELGCVNPDFYPKPVIELPSKRPGVKSELKDRDQAEYLTKADFVQAYGRCGAIAHAANPFGKGIDYGYYQKVLPHWQEQIMNLLNSHQVHLAGRPEMYLIHMKEDRDDRVHYYRFDPMEPR